MPSPDMITAYVTALTAVVAAATGAYVRWNRKAQRTLRAARKALQQNRDALETAVEVNAANRRIAMDAGVPASALKRMPRKVLVLTTADDDPEAGGAGDDPQP